MTTKVVESENPLEHWNDIKSVEGKVVLDLGCGWLFQPFESTPQYFINRGAKKIIGVDAACGEIEKLNETFPDHTFVCKTILEFNDLVNLLDLDKEIKHLKTVTQSLQAERNKIAKDIGLLKNSNGDEKKIDEKKSAKIKDIQIKI